MNSQLKSVTTIDTSSSDPAASAVVARLARARELCGPGASDELIAAVLLELGAESRWRTSRGEVSY